MQKSLVIKILGLLAISIAMLVAINSVQNLVYERQQRQAEVDRDIEAKFAGNQTVVGPVAVIQIQEKWIEDVYNKDKDVVEEKEFKRTHWHTLFPSQVDMASDVNVEQRTVGIFKSEIFKSQNRIKGLFKWPELESLKRRKDAEIISVNANLHLGISDNRGLVSIPKINWNGQPLRAQSGLGWFTGGVWAPIPLITDQSTDIPFHIDMDLNGTAMVKFAPTADQSVVQIQTNWPHPSFFGSFLPSEHQITDRGFNAEWRVNSFASDIQQKVSQRIKRNSHDIHFQDMGVRFIDPVSHYSLTDRALKYGFMFIGLTFGAFFIFELIKKLRIHPIQYSFVGIAQAVFFLLLLSLSEHIVFSAAYIASALATVSLITFYLCHVLQGISRGMTFGIGLSLVYGALYGLLNSEDHALVSGSVLLFGLLALAMFITRKVDWFNLDLIPKGHVANEN